MAHPPSIDRPLLASALDFRNYRGGAVVNPPNTIAGFACLGANVVASDIPDSGGKLSSAEIESILETLAARENSCSYAGVTSRPISLATPTTFDLVVPKGSKRLIQMVGVVDPTNKLCAAKSSLGQIDTDDNMGIFEIGRAVVDLFADRTVSITNSYSTTSAAERLNRRLDCGDNPGRFFVPDGNAVRGRIFQSGASSCTDDAATLSSTTPPTINTLFEVSSYAAVLAEQKDCVNDPANCLRTQCDIPTPSPSLVQVAYFVWEVSESETKKYPKFKIQWSGRAGHYSGAGVSTNTALGKGSVSGANVVQIFKETTSSWNNVIQTTASTLPDLAEVSGLVKDFADSNNHLWIRVVSDAPQAGSYCGTIQTDFVRLKMFK